MIYNMLSVPTLQSLSVAGHWFSMIADACVYLYLTRYLLGNQLTGMSSVEAYIIALQKGCRCVEREYLSNRHGINGQEGYASPRCVIT